MTIRVSVRSEKRSKGILLSSNSQTLLPSTVFFYQCTELIASGRVPTSLYNDGWTVSTLLNLSSGTLLRATDYSQCILYCGYGLLVTSQLDRGLFLGCDNT